MIRSPPANTRPKSAPDVAVGNPWDRSEERHSVRRTLCARAARLAPCREAHSMLRPLDGAPPWQGRARGSLLTSCVGVLDIGVVGRDLCQRDPDKWASKLVDRHLVTRIF